MEGRVAFEFDMVLKLLQYTFESLNFIIDTHEVQISTTRVKLLVRRVEMDPVKWVERDAFLGSRLYVNIARNSP